MKKNLICSICKGWGYTSEFGRGDTLKIKDCENCDGIGHKDFLIIDERKVSKKQKLKNIPDEY